MQQGKNPHPLNSLAMTSQHVGMTPGEQMRSDPILPQCTLKLRAVRVHNGEGMVTSWCGYGQSLCSGLGHHELAAKARQNLQPD